MIDVSGGNIVYYYHFDGLGSVVALSNNNRNVVEQYSYSEFGTPSITSSVGNRFMFTGREYDSETGLYYYRARFYKPSIGRFLQTDPIGYSDSMNLYQYCLNNPVNWIDPYGLITAEMEMAAGVANGSITAEEAAFVLGVTKSAAKAAVVTSPWWGAKLWHAIKSHFNASSNNSSSSSSGDDNKNKKDKDCPKQKQSEEIHHQLPKEFKDKFENAGLKVEDYTTKLEQSVHRLKPDGLHTGPNSWNQQWRQFFNKYPNAKKEQILRQLSKMRKSFKLE